MKKLFLIDGASGPTKNALVSILKDEYRTTSTKKVYLIEKESTRGYKKNENKSIQDVKEKPVSDAYLEEKVAAGLWYKYEYNGQKYGIDISDLEKKLVEFDNVFLIIRSKVLISDLKEKYEGPNKIGVKVNVVPVFIYSDKKDLEAELRSQGDTDKEIDERFRKLSLSYNDYLFDRDNIYEENIIYRGDRDQLKIIIDNLIGKYKDDLGGSDEISISKNEKYKLPGTLSIQAKEEILKNLQNFEKNIFLMISYAEEQIGIIQVIRETLHEYGYNCILAKDFTLTPDTYNTVAVSYCCKYGIAVFEGKQRGKTSKNHYDYNPNVAYEVAIMHILSKKCLILLHKSYEDEKKFFDITHMIHDTYYSKEQIKIAVVKWIKTLNS